MPDWLDRLFDMLTPPIDKWVSALRNALQVLGLVFIILALVMLAVILNDWGFSADQRERFVYLFAALMIIALVIVLILARDPEMPLHTPEERSLRHGRKFGTSDNPQSLDQIEGSEGIESVDQRALGPGGGKE